MSSVGLLRARPLVADPLARDAAGAGLLGFLLVVLVAGSSGGYSATTWGWTAVAMLWLVVVVLLLRSRAEASRFESALLLAVIAFTAWTGISAIWSMSVTSTMHEVQRDLCYLAVAAAGVLVVRRAETAMLLGGVLAGVATSSSYGLATRLLPDHFGRFDSTAFGYRLSPPITYWNGLGIFAVIGILLALGYATRAEHLWARGAAAALIPPLAATVYFTFSRGPWYALAIGLVAAVAIDPRRLQLLAIGTLLATWPVLTIFELHRRSGLVTVGAPLGEAVRDGHRGAVIVGVIAVASALTGLGAGAVERRVRIPRAVRTAFAVLVVGALIAAAAGVWLREGSPAQLARRGWDAFHNSHPAGLQGDVSVRLLSLSANGRLQLWRVSIRDFHSAPLTGRGAGTFWLDWLRYRSIPSSSLQPHSLYLGALGELGAIGLALVLALVLIPAIAVFGARRFPLAGAVFGAYVAWAAHTGIDWDWALPGVTIPGLLCGVALCKNGAAPRAFAVPLQRVVLGLASAALLFAGIVLVSDVKLRQADSHIYSAPQQAISEARLAHRFAPWSSEPYLAMGQAEVQRHDPAAAQRDLQLAAQKDPDNWRTWRMLAMHGRGAVRAAAVARVRLLNPRGTG